jgi:hypothetical protein
MDKQLEQMIEGMVSSGMNRLHAVALATSIEHSMVCPTFVAEHGTFMVAALKDFVDQVGHE